MPHPRLSFIVRSAHVDVAALLLVASMSGCIPRANDSSTQGVSASKAYQSDETQALLERASLIDEKTPAIERIHVVRELNDLAKLYRTQGRYKEAEPLYERSLVIDEKAYRVLPRRETEIALAPRRG